MIDVTTAEIESKLRAHVSSTALHEAGPLDAEDDLLASGVIDSMGVMELVSFMEDELGVPIDDDEIVAENFRSLRAMTDFAAAKIEQQDREPDATAGKARE